MLLNSISLQIVAVQGCSEPADLPLGPGGGGRFFRLCGHSHCREIRRRPSALAVRDARRVDARMPGMP